MINSIRMLFWSAYWSIFSSPLLQALVISFNRATLVIGRIMLLVFWSFFTARSVLFVRFLSFCFARWPSCKRFGYSCDLCSMHMSTSFGFSDCGLAILMDLTVFQKSALLRRFPLPKDEDERMPAEWGLFRSANDARRTLLVLTIAKRSP